MALPNSLWRILRKYRLIKTPREEIHHRFKCSETVELPETRFAREVDRALRALLAADPATRHTRVIYVRCDGSKANLAFLKERNVIYVHERWLDFWRAHSGLECTVAQLSRGEPETLFCEHVVEALYKRAMIAICPPLESPQQIQLRQLEPLQVLFARSGEKLREMPRMIQTCLVEGSRSLRVSWNDGYSRGFSRDYGSRIEYLVVLHQIGCLAEAEKLLYNKSDGSCDCPRKQVLQSVGSVMFDRLDGQPRFPMVVRFKDKAIYGLPPPAIAPAVLCAGPVSVEAPETKTPGDEEMEKDGLDMLEKIRSETSPHDLEEGSHESVMDVGPCTNDVESQSIGSQGCEVSKRGQKHHRDEGDGRENPQWQWWEISEMPSRFALLQMQHRKPAVS
jgi:hypothetical protein